MSGTFDNYSTRDLEDIARYGNLYRAQPGLRGPAGVPQAFANAPFSADVAGPNGAAFINDAAKEARLRSYSAAPASPSYPSLLEDQPEAAPTGAPGAGAIFVPQPPTPPAGALSQAAVSSNPAAPSPAQQGAAAQPVTPPPTAEPPASDRLLASLRARQAAGLPPVAEPDPVQVRVASIEGGPAGAAARNPNSSASGALQITDGLWADYAPRLGLQPSQRNDTEAQGRVFQAFRSDVTPELRGVLGRDPQPAELYGAWLLGRAGAKALYSANPGEDARTLYARVAGEGTAAAAFRNNGNILRPGMTVRDVQQSIAAYYNRRPGDDPAPPGGTAQLPTDRPASVSAPTFPQAAPVSNAAEQLQVPEQPAFTPDRSAPWMALGAGLLGGSGLADGFARGVAGFQEASQQGRRLELVAQNAASDRAFRLATARATLAASENDRAARREQFQQTREDNQQARADTLADRREGRAETLAARADALRIAAEARGEAAQVAAASRAEAGQQRQLGEVTKTELPLIETLASARETVQRGRVILNQLDNGELSLGPVGNAWSGARNWAGWSSQSSQNYAELQRYVSTTVNAILNQAKGPQTDQDAIRARENILANLNDPAVVRQGLEELVRIQSQIHADTESRIQGRRRALSLPEADLSNYGLPQIRNAAPADGILNIRRIN